MLRAASAFAVALACACGGNDGDGAAAGAPPRDLGSFSTALAKRGIALGGLQPSSPPGLDGATCKQGEADGIEVTVCEYEDESRAKKHESAGLAVVGDATGASLAQGRMLLVVADRRGLDKDGKRIDGITRAFRGR